MFRRKKKEPVIAHGVQDIKKYCKVWDPVMEAAGIDPASPKGDKEFFPVPVELYPGWEKEKRKHARERKRGLRII